MPGAALALTGSEMLVAEMLVLLWKFQPKLLLPAVCAKERILV